MRDVRDLREILRDNPVAAKSRKLFFARFLSQGIELSLGKNAIKPTPYMQRILDRHMITALRNAYEWEIIVGIVPYTVGLDEDTGEKIPVVVPFDSGAIWQGFDPLNYSLHYLFVPHIPKEAAKGKLLGAGVTKSVEELADRNVRFFIVEGRQPDIKGELRSDIRTVLHEYRELQEYERLAYSLEVAKLKQPTFFETVLPNNEILIANFKDLVSHEVKRASTREITDIAGSVAKDGSSGAMRHQGPVQQQYLALQPHASGDPLVAAARQSASVHHVPGDQAGAMGYRP
jgi:hypothetical protein